MKKMKRICAALLALCLGVSLAGCSTETAVYVQSVETLSNLGGIAPGDRFTGLVVSENVTEINRDTEKRIQELLVKEGQDVKAGDPLFSYDTDELQLTLDKQKLELEQLLSSIESYKVQIEELEKELARVGSTTKLQYTIQIQTTQLDMKEAELNVLTKQNEVAKSEELLTHSTVESPVDGRIQAVSENGMDNYGNPLPYITIQQIGSYRIKGTLGELQRGGLLEGDRVKIVSRTNPEEVWGGTVTLVDYENPTQGNNNNMIYMGSGADEMTNSSKYPFYVQLDTTEGLILGQHVYMELETEEGAEPELSISGAFLCFDDQGNPYVWAEKSGKLEKRTVTLGDYNMMRDTYAILEGLTAEDYIAFPDETLCQEGAPTTREQKVEETTAPAMAEGEVA